MDRTAGFVFWAFIFLYWMSRNDRKSALPERALLKSEYDKLAIPTIPISLEQERRLEYIVNGRKIPCTFERYYYIKLGMALPIMRIDRDVIERQYQRKVSDTSNDVAQSPDIEAANQYFTDRLNYLEHLN